MEMPKPTEAHRKLNALAGRWVGSQDGQQWMTLMEGDYTRS